MGYYSLISPCGACGMNQLKNEPKKGDTFYFQAEVIHVKYKKDHIEVRLEEYYTKSKFNLKYYQEELPETNNGDKNEYPANDNN